MYKLGKQILDPHSQFNSMQMLYRARGLGEFSCDVNSQCNGREWWTKLLQNWEKE